MANLNSLMSGGWEIDDDVDMATDFELWLESLGDEEFVPSVTGYGSLQEEPYQHDPELEPEVHSEPAGFTAVETDELPF